MAIFRQLNLLSQMRVDVPHLRSVESAVAGDFDGLIGRAMSGSKPLVVRGMTVANLATGASAITLSLVVADSIVFNINATEAGTMLWVPSGRAPEILNAAVNPKVSGSFAPNQTNYVGIDLIRTSDVTTTDLAQFLDLSTEKETGKEIPLGRTLDYKIVITTAPFSTQPNLIPIAKVVTDGSNAVLSAQDARNMMFRLSSGGDAPNTSYAYPWGQSRSESTTLGNGLFTGGDKAILSQKDWQDAVMTRLQELGGGTSWYSPAADRNVNLVWVLPTFTNGENYEWDTANLHWQGLRFVFDNSPVTYRNVQDQTTDSPGLTDLADGDCVYVDLDRSVNTPDLIPVKAPLITMGGSTPSRWILAWRVGAYIYTRQWRYPVGTTFQPATNTSMGTVALNQPPATPFVPQVFTVNTYNGLTVGINYGGANGLVLTGTNNDAIKALGLGTGSGLVATGGSSNGNGLIGNGAGGGNGIVGNGGPAGGRGGNFTSPDPVSVSIAGEGARGTGGDNTGAGTGANGGHGLRGLGGGSANGDGGFGVYGTGGSHSTGGSLGGHGVYGEGSSDGGYGVYGLSLADGSPAIYGDGGATNSDGVEGKGFGTGKGVVGTGGASGSLAVGVKGTGGGSGGSPGVWGVGASGGGPGVLGAGGAGGGYGGSFLGDGADGVYTQGGASSYGITANGGSGGAGGNFTGGSGAKGITTSGGSGAGGVGIEAIGTGANEGGFFNGGSNSPGVSGQGGSGGSNGVGVLGVSGTTGRAGVEGTGNGASARGGYFVGDGTGAGVYGEGGSGGGFGASFLGGAAGAPGIYAEGAGSGPSAILGSSGGAESYIEYQGSLVDTYKSLTPENTALLHVAAEPTLAMANFKTTSSESWVELTSLFGVSGTATGSGTGTVGLPRAYTITAIKVLVQNPGVAVDLNIDVTRHYFNGSGADNSAVVRAEAIPLAGGAALTWVTLGTLANTTPGGVDDFLRISYYADGVGIKDCRVRRVLVQYTYTHESPSSI
jgi:hypothetical protein